MALVVSTTAKSASSGLHPLSIPGCFLWLDAADSSTLTLSGSNVTQWNDKSGKGYHASNVGGGYPTFTDASTGLFFNAGQQLRTSAPSSNRTETGFMVTNFSGGGARTSIGASAAGYRSIQFDGSTGYIINRDVLLITTTPSNLPGGRRMLFSYNCADSTISLDASQIATGVEANFTQGSGVTWIGNDSRNFFYSGYIHEIILFSNALTASQQQIVEGYLSQKWNLSNRIPTSHPYRSSPAFLRPFGPLDIPGCELWMDSQDRSTLTLSGSNVTAWRDKSGNNRNAVAVGTPTLGTTTTGRPTIDFNGSSFFKISSNVAGSFTNSNMTMFVLASQTGTGRNLIHLFGNERIVSFQLYYNNQVPNGAIFFTPTNVFLNNNTLCCVTENVGVGCTVYINGVSNVSQTSSNCVQGSEIVIGAHGGYYSEWIGNIQEVVIYNRALSTTDRQNVDGYFAWKWGIQSNIPSSNLYKVYRPLVPVFSPVTIPGCALWLDATDNATITFTGSNLTSWRDKSGFGYNFNTAPSGCSLPVLGNSINGRQTIGITSAVMGIKQATIIDGLKTILWVRRERTGNRGYEFYFGADGSADFHTGVSEYAGSGLAQNGVRDACLNLITSNGLSSTTTLGTTNVSSASDINILQITNLTGSTRIQGLSYDRGNTFRSIQCDWGEILFYTTNLSTAQLRTIEGYFAHKWGIQSFLSNAHQHKLFAP